ncbi:MAG TPA: hypothetical protein VNS88_18075 [Nitrospiraceae bacterium]|nr:hypothetical protein [Nitrospiraceae bacterium]
MLFNPLLTLRELRDDDQLTTAEFAVLVAAVLRTDNQTGRVRASQELLARDARISSATIKRVYRSERFRRWFDVTKVGRQVHLTWIGVTEIRVTKGVTVTPHLLSTTSTKPVRENYSSTEDYLEAENIWLQRSIG